MIALRLLSVPYDLAWLDKLKSHLMFMELALLRLLAVLAQRWIVRRYRVIKLAHCRRVLP